MKELISQQKPLKQQQGTLLLQMNERRPVSLGERPAAPSPPPDRTHDVRNLPACFEIFPYSVSVNSVDLTLEPLSSPTQSGIAA